MKLCAECKRHLRLRDTSCAFCGAAATPQPEASTAGPGGGPRLSRAERIFGVGALALMGAQACGSSAQPVYGAPFVLPEDAGADRDADKPDVSVADGGRKDADANDAGADALVFDPDSAAPPYGAPAYGGPGM